MKKEKSIFDFKNKELIGTGSNGSRVYKILNTKDQKVTSLYIIFSYFSIMLSKKFLFPPKIKKNFLMKLL